MANCKHRDQPFWPATTWQEFCSAKCRNSWHYVNHLAAERKRLRQRQPQLDAAVATMQRQQEPLEPAVAGPRVRRA